MILADGYFTQKEEKSFACKYPFENIKTNFQRADIVFKNLEYSLSKSDVIRE